MINLICLHLGLIEPPDHIVLHLALMPDFINPLFHGGGNFKKNLFFFPFLPRERHQQPARARWLRVREGSN